MIIIREIFVGEYKEMLLEKSQPIRLLDVFLIGPFLVWYGLKYDYSRKHKETANQITKTILLCIGFYTIVYNAYNFIGHYTPLYPLM